MISEVTQPKKATFTCINKPMEQANKQPTLTNLFKNQIKHTIININTNLLNIKNTTNKIHDTLNKWHL